MGFFDKLKCKTGLHKGEWVLKSEGQCVFELKCERCGDVKEKIEHSLASPVPSGENCRYAARCSRCGHEEISVEHKFSPWTYESPTSCRQVRFCLQCNTPELGQTVHKYEEISKDEESGSSTHRCEHCGHEKVVNQ